MAIVTIFTKDDCPESQATRLDLKSRHIPFREIVLEASEQQTAVPEIYFDNHPVPGGVDELLNILQKWEVVTGEDGLPGIMPVKPGQQQIDQYYIAEDAPRTSSPSRGSSSSRGPHNHQRALHHPTYDTSHQGGHHHNEDSRRQQQGERDPEDRRSYYEEGPVGRDHYQNSHSSEQQQRGHSYEQSSYDSRAGNSNSHSYQNQRDPYQQQNPNRDAYQQHNQRDPRDQYHQHREHQDPHYQQQTQRQPQQQQQHRDSLPAKGATPSFLQRPSKRSGLRGDNYQRHSFHGRTLYEDFEADDAATISNPNADDASVSSRQSSTRSGRNKSTSSITSRPHSFHGSGLRRKDFEADDEATVTNPNDDDVSVSSRQSFSSRHGRDSITSSASSSRSSIRGGNLHPEMKREVSIRGGNLRKEMKREASMRSGGSLHGSVGSLYASLNCISNSSDSSFDNDDTDNHEQELDDVSYSRSGHDMQPAAGMDNGNPEFEGSFSISPEDLRDFEDTKEQPALTVPSRRLPFRSAKRASSMRHLNPRNYERNFMTNLNSRSASHLNYERDNIVNQNSRSASNISLSGAWSADHDGVRRLSRRDLGGARSYSPTASGSSRGGRRAQTTTTINTARSGSPTAATTGSHQQRSSAQCPPSLRSSAMRIATDQQSLNNSTTSTCSYTAGLIEEYKHTVEIPKGRTLSITDATLELLQIIPLSNLKYNLTTYRKSFSGTMGTDTFQKEYNLSRADAEDLGKALGRAKILHHVCFDHDFEDSGKFFYRLQCQQTPEILNSFCVWQDEKTLTKQSADVMFTIQQELQQLLDVITDQAKGRIHYSRATSDLVAKLDYAVCELQQVKLARMDKKSLLAFGLNIFQLFLHYAFIKMGIPASSSGQTAFWTGLKFNVGGDLYSFSDWWNGICRGNRKGPYGPAPFKGTDPRKFLNFGHIDPRIHFAAGMTNFMRPLFFYSGQNLDVELELAARAYCRKEGLISVDTRTTTLKLAEAFQVYTSDFSVSAKGLPKALMHWLPGKAKVYIDEALTIGKKVKVVFHVKGKCDDWNDYAGDYVIFKTTPQADCKKLIKKKPEVRREIKRSGSLVDLLALGGGGGEDGREEKE